jgi:uncharacterized protein YxeA
MKFILTILALALVAGISVATLENGDLSNIDPAVFDGAQFSKEGVSAGSESDMTSSMSAFAKDGSEKDAKLAGAFEVPQKLQPTQPIFGFGERSIGVGDATIAPSANVIFSFGVSPIPAGDKIITPPVFEPTFTFGKSPIPVGDSIITPPADVTFSFGEMPLFGNTESPQPDQNPIFGFGHK